MTETTNEYAARLPRQKVFEANFPMYDHVCDSRKYRLDRHEKTDRAVGGKTVVKYVFILADDAESGSK